MVVLSLSNGILMKLPIKVPIKIRKMINGVKPIFSKAMLMAPKKSGQQQQTIGLVRPRRIESYAGSKLFSYSYVHSL